jgi:hypothetical protein
MQIEKNREELNNAPNRMVREIKRRFEQAKDEGLKELANIALFQSFLPSSENLDGNSRHKGPQKRIIEKTENQNPMDTLSFLGLSDKKISSLLAASDLSKEIGLIVAVKGLGSRLVVENLARLVGGSSSVVIDMEVGVLQCPELNSLIRTNGKPSQPLAILDANLSSLDVYGRSLFDYVLNRIAINSPPHAPVLLSLSDSSMAVSLPPDLLQVMVLIDLDNFSESGISLGRDISDIRQTILNQDNNSLSSLFWPPLIERLRMYVTKKTSNEGERLGSLAAILEHQKNGRINQDHQTGDNWYLRQ